MSDPVFFASPKPMTLAQVADLTGARLVDPGKAELLISGIAPLSEAGPGDLAFLDNPAYAKDLAFTKACAVLVAPKFLSRVPEAIAALEAREPYRAFAMVGGRFYPAAVRLEGAFGGDEGISPAAHVHPSARLEPGVTVEPGAVIGARVEIGTGTIVGANAVIGHDVRIGRDGHIGATASIIHSLLGNRVIVHPGVRLGQDGFGFAMGARGHLKVPQIGRVIIQDDVEIGANSCIDRGATRDTVIGEGTKIDNGVQIGHNVVIGRHCVIVAHVGISGSTTLEDYVVMGGKSGTVGHIRIGMGAQIAGTASVKDDVPAGARWGGTPAKPLREFARELAALKALAKRKPAGGEEV
ncbi:MAG: UDP-3-O-(3-hydroxymyristoyl)glucosamine N-acyltransferase [Hyphomicrobiaceae bacterium]|nr:UDP-3-O-(3-hydroxymyristoyl)glucosamine N-acyltransferase [Hyphomicrobiaceae bacterium]